MKFKHKKNTNIPKHSRHPVYEVSLLKSVLTVPKLRNAMLITLLLLLIYRIGCSIPTPGTDITTLVKLFSQSSLLNMMQLLGGGSIENYSIFSLGVTPYITASIIVQLLSMDVIPKLKDWTEDGEKGQIKLNRVTKILGFALAGMQAYTMLLAFNREYNIIAAGYSWRHWAYIIAIQMGGFATTVWLADTITRFGIGNGLSMIIFFGIIVRLPSTFVEAYNTFIPSTTGAALALGIGKFALFCAVYLFIIIAVIFIETSERRIVINYSGRSSSYASNNNYLPIKVNSANVIPVIFAQSLISTITTITSWINHDTYEKLQDFFSLGTWHGLVVYAILIILFTFMYTYMQLNPEDMAKNLSKNGSNIPSIRPGKDTATYIYKTSFRVTVAGAAGLMILALLPNLLTMLTGLSVASAIGGTGVIIVVGVAMETMGEMRSVAVSTAHPKYF